jgi:A/G-specific adenine glycosylase
MDYGAALKKLTPNPGRRSAHYNRQSKFQGSFRQIRGSLVRALISRGLATAEELRARLDVPADKADFYRALEVLEKESIVAEEGGKYRIR